MSLLASIIPDLAYIILAWSNFRVGTTFGEWIVDPYGELGVEAFPIMNLPFDLKVSEAIDLVIEL